MVSTVHGRNEGEKHVERETAEEHPSHLKKNYLEHKNFDWIEMELGEKGSYICKENLDTIILCSPAAGGVGASGGHGGVSTFEIPSVASLTLSLSRSEERRYNGDGHPPV